MIKLEEILDQVQKEKDRSRPNKEKETALLGALQETLSKWAIATDKGDTVQAKRLTSEAERIKGELDTLANLNTAKESGIFGRLLRREGSLGKMAKNFETQQLAEFERLLSERDKAHEAYKKVLDKLYDAAANVREYQHKAGKLISTINAVKEYIDDPVNTDSLQYRFFTLDAHINPGIKLKQAWDRPIIRELEAMKESEEGM